MVLGWAAQQRPDDTSPCLLGRPRLKGKKETHFLLVFAVIPSKIQEAPALQWASLCLLLSHFHTGCSCRAWTGSEAWDPSKARSKTGAWERLDEYGWDHRFKLGGANLNWVDNELPNNHRDDHRPG